MPAFVARLAVRRRQGNGGADSEGTAFHNAGRALDAIKSFQVVGFFVG